MENKHKDIIRLELTSLVEGTDNLDDLMKILKRKKILNALLIENIRMEPTVEKQKRKLYEILPRRGPSAFKELYNSFMEIGYFGLAELLGRGFSDVQVKQALRRMDIDHTVMYPMRSNPKGLMLLINIVKYRINPDDERLGAEKDEIELIQLWTKLGYKVFAYRDLDTQTFKEKIVEFRKYEKHWQTDSVVVFIMTHGDQNSKHKNQIELKTKFGPPVNSEWIVEQFSVNNCPGLKEKPKLFFFQCCRGADRDHGIVPDSGLKTVPNRGDVLIAYATCPGKVSLRDEELGAHFVQKIVSVFKEKACQVDLMTMMAEVSREVRKIYVREYGFQVINFVARHFDKKLYFNPGLFGDGE